MLHGTNTMKFKVAAVLCATGAASAAEDPKWGFGLSGKLRRSLEEGDEATHQSLRRGLNWFFDEAETAAPKVYTFE